MRPLKGTILVRYPANASIKPTPHDLEPFVAKGLCGTQQFQTVACDVTKRPEMLPSILASLPDLRIEATIESLDGKLITLTPHSKDSDGDYQALLSILFAIELATVINGAA